MDVDVNKCQRELQYVDLNNDQQEDEIALLRYQITHLKKQLKRDEETATDRLISRYIKWVK